MITLTSPETGVIRTTLSNASGAYVLVGVPPGEYILQAAKEGFKSVSQPDFRLYVNQTATYDFELPLGLRSETITVIAYPNLESSTAELGTVVAERSVKDRAKSLR